MLAQMLLCAANPGNAGAPDGWLFSHDHACRRFPVHAMFNARWEPLTR